MSFFDLRFAPAHTAVPLPIRLVSHANGPAPAKERTVKKSMVRGFEGLTPGDLRRVAEGDVVRLPDAAAVNALAEKAFYGTTDFAIKDALVRQAYDLVDRVDGGGGLFGKRPDGVITAAERAKIAETGRRLTPGAVRLAELMLDQGRQMGKLLAMGAKPYAEAVTRAGVETSIEEAGAFIEAGIQAKDLVAFYQDAKVIGLSIGPVAARAYMTAGISPQQVQTAVASIVANEGTRGSWSELDALGLKQTVEALLQREAWSPSSWTIDNRPSMFGEEPVVVVWGKPKSASEFGHDLTPYLAVNVQTGKTSWGTVWHPSNAPQ